jgi:Tfp pilus assembly protein PilF
MSVLSPVGRFAAIVSIGLASVGCSTTSGAKSSWLPWSSSAAPKADAMGATTGTLSDTSRGVVGQWNTMTSAAGSALSKTKNAVTGVFAGTPAATPGSKQDPTSLSTKVESIGPEVYIAYGQVCEGTGKFGDAMENYEKALKISPTNGPALASVARLHDRQNNHAQAIDYYQKAIAATPNDAQLYSDLGMLYSRTGQVDEGCKKLEQAIAIRPNESKYHSNLAAVQLDSGKSDKAMETLQKVNAPAAANYNMALLLVQRNQIQNAQQHLTTALQQDPNMQPARELLTKLGGAQAVQQTYNAYQTANNVYQGVRDLSNMVPAGTAGTVANPTLPAGYQPNAAANTMAPNTNAPTVNGAAPLTNLPAIPYVPSLEAGAGSSFR